MEETDRELPLSVCDTIYSCKEKLECGTDPETHTREKESVYVYL